MSELRQRRGETQAQAESDKDTDKDAEIDRLRQELEASKEKTKDMTEEEQRTYFTDELIQALEASRPVPAKGVSTKAKKCKEQLAADPFNMMLILELGCYYAEDLHWNKVCTVLLRGWKRVNEFSDTNMKTQLLCLLAQSSEKIGKYRQALAVAADIDELADIEIQTSVDLIRCRSYCKTNNKEKGLQTIMKVINNNDFQKGVAAWASCLEGLKLAGIYDVTRAGILERATDEEKKTVERVEQLALLRDEYNKELDKAEIGVFGVFQQNYKRYLVGFVVVLVAILYWLESQSLRKLA